MSGLWEFRFSLPRPPQGGVVELSAEEVEKVLLEKLQTEVDSPCQALWELARFYKGEKRFDDATACLARLLGLITDLDGRAACVLTLGQIREQQEDYRGAVRHYKEALGLEPGSDFTWYFIHNNLGFCLAMLGSCAEAERYCRAAIRIDPGRPNAHKNLGLALQARGDLESAAESYILSTRANASDPRASQLLDQLLAAHPGLEERFGEDARCCREAVRTAERENSKRKPVVHRGWRKQWFLFHVRLKSLCKRFLRHR